MIGSWPSKQEEENQESSVEETERDAQDISTYIYIFGD